MVDRLDAPRDALDVLPELVEHRLPQPHLLEQCADDDAGHGLGSLGLLSVLTLDDPMHRPRPGPLPRGHVEEDLPHAAEALRVEEGVLLQGGVGLHRRQTKPLGDDHLQRAAAHVGRREASAGEGQTE